MRFFLALGLALFSPYGVAAVTPTDSLFAPAIGYMEVRPSWNGYRHRFYSENGVYLVQRPTPRLDLAYKQYFHQSLEERTGPALDNGFFQATVRGLWTADDRKTALHYRIRTYVPFSEAKRAAGLITVVRNYLMLKRVTPQGIRLTAIWMPTLHFYRSPGGLHDGHLEANPYLENRLYFSVGIPLTNRLLFYLPLKVSSLRYDDWNPKARFNDQWIHTVRLQPLLLYLLTANTAVGLSANTDNLILPNATKLAVGDGLERSTVQLVLHAGL